MDSGRILHIVIFLLKIFVVIKKLILRNS